MGFLSWGDYGGGAPGKSAERDADHGGPEGVGGQHQQGGRDQQDEGPGQQAAACSHLPSGVVPAHDGAAVRAAVPVLWLTADGDPQDPPANLTAVTTQEPDARVVVVPAQQHVVGHLGCLPSVIADFLDTGRLADLDTSCVADTAPAPPFRLQ